MGTDPVSGEAAGRITTREKGGKHTEHFVQPSTYRELETHIAEHGQPASPYRTFLRAVEAAARPTGQYAPGRGAHGLKHSFAQPRSIANARELPDDDAIVRVLDEAAAANFDMEAAGALFDYRPLRLAEGDLVARLWSTHGMLIPSVDPLKPPFRPVGQLWENGDFARNSSSSILSFVNSVGVILAAA